MFPSVHNEVDEWEDLVFMKRIHAEGGVKDTRVGAWGSPLLWPQLQDMLGLQGKHQET